jgi:hypothetical protein
MASTAFQTIYRQEFVASFEERASLLRSACTTAANITGNSAVFLVAGSGGATAVTRGVNGLIPARSDDLTQNSCALTEWHDLPQRTGFNIESSQGDGRRIMQENSMGVINRKIDSQIIAELDTATQDTGAAAPFSLALVAKAIAILGNAEVPIQEEDNMFGVITPAAHAYLMQIPAFTSADYVEVKPFAGPVRRFRRWFGVNWIVHPNLSGVGTAAEECYLFHRSAIGHAANKDVRVAVGRDEEQDYTWARTSIYMGAKLLQNTGVVNINHDGSAFAAS